jgi:hypothetical protein
VGNAVDTDPAVVTLDGTEIDNSLPSGKTVKTTALAGTHTVTFTDGAALEPEHADRRRFATEHGGFCPAIPTPMRSWPSIRWPWFARPPPVDPGTAGTNPPVVDANTTTAVSPKFTG